MPGRLWLALGGLVAVMLVATWAVTSAYQHGRQVERADALERSMTLIRDRSKTNETIRRMSDGDLCRELGGLWLPDEGRCE